ncbi:ESAG8 [Symbiodinium sp. CCMP2592]|nr:ESAG8 [Symbiodinium sp. CCMP2592]
MCLSAVLAVLHLQAILVNAERGQVDLPDWQEPGHARKGRRGSVLAPDVKEPESVMEDVQVEKCSTSDTPVLREWLRNLGVDEHVYRSDDHCTWDGIKCWKKPKQNRCSVRSINMALSSYANRNSPVTYGLRGRLGPVPVKSATSIEMYGSRHLNGDLASFADLGQLKLLYLQDTNITGDLRSLQNLTRLRYLHLGNLAVGGSLENLAKITTLRKLRIQYSHISGDLRHLRHLKDMGELFLQKTRVTGTLQGIESMNNLRYLQIRNTRVDGNLASVHELSKMLKLDISGTNVSGDLSHLKRMTSLTHLKATGTRLSGSIDSLKVMPELTELDLSGNSDVIGDISSLVGLDDLTQIRLAFTSVHGRLSTQQWEKQLFRLTILDLTATRSKFLLGIDDSSELNFLNRVLDDEKGARFILPSLRTLKVSGCPLNTTMSEFRTTLKFLPNLTTIAAAGCDLRGELSGGFGPLDPAWLYLDLSDNDIRRIDVPELPMFFGIARSKAPFMEMNLLENALRKGSSLDFTGVDFVNSRGEPRDLFLRGVFRTTSSPSMVNQSQGSACKELMSSNLKVAPALFLPEELCGCLPGWEGHGVQCRKCRQGYYNPAWNVSACVQCPPGSNTTEPGASSIDVCLCREGRIFNFTGTPRCMCEAHTALHKGMCATCDELFLDCPQAGATFESAVPKTGYARLRPGADVYRCLDHASDRCNATDSQSELGCAEGYEGPLCTACAESYRGSAGRCLRCTGAAEGLRWHIQVGAAILAVIVVGGFLLFWRKQSLSPRTPVPEDATVTGRIPTASQALWPLLLAQGPVLLQLGQLWAVLVALSGTSANAESDTSGSGLWEQEYVQWLQLTASSLRDAISLDCAYGRMSSTICALVAPCVLPLLLILCMLAEAMQRGRGVKLALPALSLLFIGGASSWAKLIHCQRVDGDGTSLPEADAFKSQLPHLTCSETSGEAVWAYAVGVGCAVAYGILIPAFLLYLILKQHLLLSPSRRYVSFADRQGDKTIVQVVAMGPQADEADAGASEKDLLEKRGRSHFLASAVAYSAVFFHGSISLQREDSALTIRAANGVHGEKEDEFDVTTAVAHVLEHKDDADLMRWQAISRMLTERCILEEAQTADRIFAGANEIFFKYAACEQVWVEVALKTVAVALVAAASTYQNVFMTVGLTLGTATVFLTLQPYRQRQVNDLQCCCFLCLTVAATGFACSFKWLSRASLAVPLLLAAVQTLRPDGPEALALRLFEAATRQWPALQKGEVIQLSVTTVSFL